MKVTKEMTFDAAHMLSNYNGLCANLHGHTYKVQATIEDEMSTTDSMVMDFNDLKKIMSEVIDRYDHALIISSKNFRSAAEQSLLNWAVMVGMKTVEIDEGRSTSECIASAIKHSIAQNPCLEKARITVKLWETPTSFCEV